LPIQEPVDVTGGPSEIVRHARPVAHQIAIIRVFPLGVEGGDARRCGQCDDLPAMVPEHPVRQHGRRTECRTGHLFDGCFARDRQSEGCCRKRSEKGPALDSITARNAMAFPPKKSQSAR
jgi:hypothetical protein